MQFIDDGVGVASEDATIIQPYAALGESGVGNMAGQIEGAVVGQSHVVQMKAKRVGKAENQCVVLPNLGRIARLSGKINVLCAGDAEAY